MRLSYTLPKVKTSEASFSVLKDQSGAVGAAVLQQQDDTSAGDEEIPWSLQPVVSEDRTALQHVKTVLNQKIWWGEVVDEQTFNDGKEYVDQWPASVVVPADGRVSGDLLPFSMTTDDYVGSALLMMLAISALLLARSSHFLLISAKAFFSTRKRENLFNDISDARMQGKFFFALVVCASLSILTYDYQQSFYSLSVQEVSPYLVLGVNFSIFSVGYLLRTVLYAFVNTVFFDKESNDNWMESYHLLTVVSGILFLPLALLVVFYELDFSNWQILFLFLASIVEIFLIFKTYHIFFEGALGFLHLILYLCTLEFLPLLTLWKGMVWVTQELTKLV